MLEAFWLPLLSAWAGGLALSWALEGLLAPPPAAPWARPASAVAMHAGVWTLAFALELVLFRRPYFGAANVLALQGILVLVSAAKFRTLREPFVYADFEYFVDALRHPRLYLPFLGWGGALALAMGYGAALWVGLVWEASLASVGVTHFFAAAAGLAVTGWAVAAYAARRPCRLSLDADVDLARLGLVAMLWQYGRLARQPLLGEAVVGSPYATARVARPAVALPDLVSVQSESFFDARRIYPQLRRDLLAGFDALRAQAAAHGRLRVAAWGANTVRTEFAFLSGLAPQALGVHRYHPYRALRRHGLPSLASYLRARGYRTVCVHPYYASFYGRDRVLPWLGFDEFIHLEQFADAARAGPYVADAALADYVACRLGSDRTVPLYLHVITMENHGPLHWETVTPADAAQVLRAPLPAGCEDLVAYARHLRNADTMFGQLARALALGPRPGGLCVFGDHVPIMSQVYQALGEPDGDTDYLIWNAHRPVDAPARPLAAQDLGCVFLRQMGVMEGCF